MRLQSSVYVREWALSQWEEKTQVSLAEELPQLKALILETREREARLAAEEAARLAAEEEAAAEIAGATGAAAAPEELEEDADDEAGGALVVAPTTP